MKAKIIKRVMSGALAAALVMAPAMSAAAANSSSTPGSSSSEGSTVVDEAVESTSTESETTVADVPSTSSVAGVATTTAGVYLASSVDGAAITSSVASITSSYGLASNETPYVKISDMDPKKSYLAKAAIDAAAASQGAVVGPMINLELGKMTNGKYSLLSSDGAAIRVSFGIPASFAQSGKTYAVVRVQSGGVVSILADVDTNPNTVTFDTTGGAGAYAIIKY